MRTCHNKNYALYDSTLCGHYPLVNKRTGKCVACEKIAVLAMPLISASYSASVVGEGDGICIEHGYTTQERCAELLEAIYGERVRTEVPIGISRMRADIMLDGDLIVEFDGPTHYTNAKTIASDEKKAALCKELGIRLCRVPFFVQLYYETAMLIGITDKLYVETSFPNGWVTADVYPASFCEAGTLRFYSEFASYPAWLQDALLVSLKENAEGAAKNTVVTESQLAHLLAIRAKAV